MGLGFRLYAFLFLSFSSVGFAADPPVLGRFSGILRHEALQRDQLATLDLIQAGQSGNIIFLKAVLKLHFGDFKNPEYVAYHWDDVRFNLFEKTFAFYQPDQSVTLVGKLQSDKTFSGEFRAYGSVGTAHFSSEGSIEPELPLIEPLSGEYRGLCESKVKGEKRETWFQIYTYRSSEGAGHASNPFRAYKVKGFIGEDHGFECGPAKMCNWGNIRSGSYNFFKNQIQFFSNYRDVNCTTTPEGLSCDGCAPLKRASTETHNPRSFIPPYSKSEFDGGGNPTVPLDSMESIRGEYTGYLHHEFLDRYQLGSLNIMTYQTPPEPGGTPTLRMSANASLYFGSTAGAEAITYQFDERSYPGPFLTKFVFSQPGTADVDAILQVTSVGKGVVRGIWFSQLFGRVGTFEFFKQGAPPLPKDVMRFETISGAFQGTSWEMDLRVALGIAPPGNDNPFAPLAFGGYSLLSGISSKRPITGGTYDFYTGRIGIEVGENMVFVGNRQSGKRLFLKKLYSATPSPLSAFEPEPYRRVIGD